MLSWETLQQFGPYGVSLLIAGLWLKREIDRGDQAISIIREKELENKELQQKVIDLAEKGQASGYEMKQLVATMQGIIAAAGRTP